MTILLAGVGCLALASVIGGATGFGTALVATPLMLLIGMDVTTVVVVNLVAGLITRVAVAVRMREHMNRSRVRLLCAGSVPGALAGAMLLAYLPKHLLEPAAGAAVMLCGVWLAIPYRIERAEPHRMTQAATGVVGGFMTSTTSLGGPPPVLLMQRARVPPPTFIADLAGYFVVTNAFALVFLFAKGAMPQAGVWTVLPLFVLAAMLGNAVGLRIARRMSTAIFRSVVIALVIAAGAVALIPT
ncbi:sulfite exporter TauE/SafE family protein [Prescottella equi]|uniref:sulfite exporter TauE/SafE family protein n=1 Tax=Rhodococcus hoagii TaxID=43767 RepID=UPI00384EC2B1